MQAYGTGIRSYEICVLQRFVYELFHGVDQSRRSFEWLREILVPNRGNKLSSDIVVGTAEEKATYKMNFNNSSNQTVKDCLLDKNTFATNGNPSIQILNCILTIPTSITATLTNLVVLVSVASSPSLREPYHALLVSLSLSDLGVGIVAQPTFVIYNVAKIKRMEDLFCSTSLVLSIVGFCLSGVSFLTLTGISLDRYIALRLHLRYKEIVTMKPVTVLLVLVWLVMVIGATSILWAGYYIVDYLSLVVIFLCLVFICFAYVSIFTVIRRHQTQINALVPGQQVQDSLNIPRVKKSCWTMLLLHVAFVLSFLPYFTAMVVMSVTGRSVAKQSTYEIAFAIVFINSTLNPIVYCWGIGEIREAVMKTVKKPFSKTRLRLSREKVDDFA